MYKEFFHFFLLKKWSMSLMFADLLVRCCNHLILYCIIWYQRSFYVSQLIEFCLNRPGVFSINVSNTSIDWSNINANIHLLVLFE